MSYISANSGYKTLKSKDIGPYLTIEYDLIKSEKIKPSTKLVYAFLKSYMSRATRIAVVSMNKLVIETGYSKTTINQAIRSLHANGAIDIRKRMSMSGPGRDFNEYEFKLEGNMFAMITMMFLESRLLSIKEKEFIISVFPYILGNDTLGSIENPATISSIAKSVHMTYNTVGSRIDSLKKKGLIRDHYTKYGTHGRDRYVGFKLDMFSIMIDNMDAVLEDRARLRDILTEKGLRY